MAQKDVGAYLHANLFVSFPQGAFASTDLNRDDAGFAGPGAGLSVLFGNKVYKGFGITFKAEAQVNSIYTESLEAGLAASNPNFNWKLSGANWTIAGLSIGPHYSLNLKRWAFDARVLAGALNFNSPEINLEGSTTSGSGNATYIISKKQTNSWSLSFDLSVKYEFKRDWVLVAGTGYLMANPKFSNVKNSLYTNDVLISENLSNYQQSFRLLQANLGVGYVF